MGHGASLRRELAVKALCTRCGWRLPAVPGVVSWWWSGCNDLVSQEATVTVSVAVEGSSRAPEGGRAWS